MSKQSSVHFFPVGNGDMTLLKVASGDRYYSVLIDIHIRGNGADDDDKCDALEELYARLEKDSSNRPYVDVMLLTHPDQDHIRGFGKHFHQGDPNDYVVPSGGERGKILIGEIWSSPMVFRRKRKTESICEDATAFKSEAKRRVELFRKKGSIGVSGNRVRIIGEDIEGKTDDILEIVYRIGSSVKKLNEAQISELSIDVLGPLADDEFEDQSTVDKNRSSVITRWSIASHGYQEPTNFLLFGGDARAEVWEIIWSKHSSSAEQLQYDLLIAPHHCSWRTLSRESYSKSANPTVEPSAKSALSQGRKGAVIIASSDPIKDNDIDPPNYKAKGEYESIATGCNGRFVCLADNVASRDDSPSVLSYRLTRNGPQKGEANSAVGKNSVKKRNAAVGGLLGGSGEAIGHG